MVCVRNHRPGSLNLRFGVKLLPGDNDVDPEAWKQCRVDPITVHYLQAGDIEVIVSGSQMPTAKASTAKSSVAVEVEATPIPVDDSEEDTDEIPCPSDDEPTDPDATPRIAVEGVSKMKAKDVIGMLQGINEEMILKQVLMTETRPTVRTAIERRLQEIKG